jgi:hypothetical protein
VKCDEARPACKNCLTWRGSGGKCGGYEPEPGAEETVTQREADIKSTSLRVVPGTGIMQLAPTNTAAILIEPDGDVRLFRNDMEKTHFDDWIKAARGCLGGGIFHSTLWMTTLPQLSRGDQTLRYGAMAIGAMFKAVLQDGEKSPGDADFLVHNRHYASSIEYYCRALHIQAKTSADSGSLWAAILSCALFVCFEALREDHCTALKHVSHGITLLHRVGANPFQSGSRTVAKGATADALITAPRSIMAETLRDYERLEVQCRTFLSKTPNTKFASSKTVPGPTIHMLTGHACYTSAAYFHTQRYADSTYSMRDMPVKFASLEDARTHWELTQRRIWGLYPLMMSVVDGMQIPSTISNEDLETTLDTLQHNPTLSTFQSESLHYLDRLHMAFQTIFDKCRRNKSQDMMSYLQSLSLQLQYLITYIYAATPRFCTLSAAEAMTPKYTMINILAEEVLQILTTGPTPGLNQFSMDSGLIWPVFMVSIGCRDAGVRDEAIRILGTYPRKDGLWDSRAMLAISLRSKEVERVLGVEGEGTREERWRRLRRREFAFGEDGRTALLRYMRRDDHDGERWQFVEEGAEYMVAEGEVHWRLQPLSSGAPILSDIG